MYQILSDSEANVVGIEVSGRLTDADYKKLVPELERRIEEHGALRILFAMRDFKGWTAGALWDDLSFDVEHNREIERAAMVGEKSWQRWMTQLMKPFAHAETKYFELGERDAAWSWLRSG